MSRTLSSTLTAEMDSPDRTPAMQVTAERWLPEWTAKISGLSGGQTEQYAHGHAAAVYPDGNGAGEDILFRARSGSYASPQNGTLYVARIMGTDLDDPTTWDSLWASTGISGLMYPAWTANSGASHGGSLAVAVWDNGGTPTGRVFYITNGGSLRYIDVNLSSGAISGPTTIASLGTGVQLASMQIAAVKYDEVFVLVNQLVESSLAAWHKDIYGSFIRRYYLSGSWQADNSFHFHTHAEGGLLRDGPLEGSDFGDTSADGVTAQWGKRWGGGLAANQIDANTVLVALGLTFWRRWGYDTHSQGLMSFIYHRDSGWWERGPEAGGADFTEGNRLDFDSLARGCQVEGQNFIIWNRSSEPADYDQVASGVSLPRIQEVVYAKVADDGKYLTQFQYLGDQDDLTAASLVAVNHGGGKLLYALGWRSVFESPPAAFICSVSTPEDLRQYCSSAELSLNNRGGMGIDLTLKDPASLLDPDNLLKAGALVRFNYGIPGELVQVGQGLLDLNTPSLQANPDGNFNEAASLACRADEPLLNTRAEAVEDVLPQNVIHITPDDPIKHVSLSKGYWSVTRMYWPNTFFAGTYGALNGQAAWRLWSFPYANTGGGGGNGDPGRILNERGQHKGTWFKDITWLAMPPMVDGSLEASVRFGDVYNQANFTFQAANGTQMYTTVNRSNGVITTINWRTGGFGGPIWNTVAQYACMAGLICHAVEVGRKYALVWEYESNFAVSSHTDDTWRGENFDRADYSSHGMGTNRLYLIVSDYDASGNWVNKSVAGGITASGLTPGQPADLKMVVSGGTIFCYYRLHSTGIPNQWRYAFSYKAGRFGAANFGLVGRGHAGIQWDVLYPGKNYIARCDNYVDFWDIKLSDAVPDRTLEEHLRRYAWRGFTPPEFKSEVDEASRVINAGVNYSYDTPVENLSIDFKVSIPASGNEAGVFVRGVSQASPANECIKLGLVPHSTANSATNTVNYYVVKRRYAGGAEVTGARAYAPIPKQLTPGAAVPVRITARGPLYSVWIAGNYAGHFIDETPLGLYFGLYAVGGNATFSGIRVPELYEVSNSAILEVNQAMNEAINKLIGRRRIKRIFQWNGALKFSYFFNRDSGPDFHDNMWRSSIQRNSRYLSKVRVQGANTHAIFQSSVLARQGQRFQVVSNPEIEYSEFAYKEAQAIVSETAERQAQATFSGLPDLRVQPEDEVSIIISRFGIAGNFIVDDLKIGFDWEEEPNSEMVISTRQTVAL